MGRDEQGPQEPWYLRGCFAYLWFIVYALILLPAALVAAIVAYGWYFYFWSLIDRYPWVANGYFTIWQLPFGWFAPYLVVGLGALPFVRLLFFLGKTPFWQSTARKIVLVYMGITVVFIAAGMGYSTHRALGEYLGL